MDASPAVAVDDRHGPAADSTSNRLWLACQMLTVASAEPTDGHAFNPTADSGGAVA